MSNDGYGYRDWEIPALKSSQRDSSEKAYLRKSLPDWDNRWHALSPAARLAFLEHVKIPVKSRSPGREIKQSGCAASLFAPEVLDELVRDGFVTVKTISDGRTKSKSPAARVFAHDDTADFIARLRILRRFHLLTSHTSAEFFRYISTVYYGGAVTQIVHDVLRKADIHDSARIESLIAQYVLRHRWPGWVARALKNPLASAVIDAVRQAEGPIPLVDLVHQFEGNSPEDIRAVVDKLVVHMALVEDLQPKTHALVVGFPPTVRETLRAAEQPRVRPPLVAVESPADLVPESNLFADDLRTLLLEIAGSPPLVRRDHTLFQKEADRVQAAMNPLPAWLLEFLQWTPESRYAQAFSWSYVLKLVTEIQEGPQLRLHLSAEGRDWLSRGLDAQEASILARFRTPATRELYLEMIDRILYLDPNQSYYFDQAGDREFLGVSVTVLKIANRSAPLYHGKSKPEDHDALRQALDQALGALKQETFYLLESIAKHLAFAEHNPLNRGLPLAQTAVYWAGRSIPPLEEQREEIGRQLIRSFIQHRLVPCGAFRAATDAQGRVAVARAPRYDAYFGREIVASTTRAAAPASQVVVQPDFSVIVIGMNTAPIAELAPFCDRGASRGHQGATLFKITRDSVVRAIGQGLKPSEIVERLQRHATHDIPANVRREIQEWTQWARPITASTHTLLRCPDRETADRAMGVFKQQAERLNETTIALDARTLATADRNRLRAQGLLLQTQTPKPEATPAVKRKSRRGW